MRRGAALAGAVLALALVLAPAAAHAVDPLGPWPGSVRPPAPVGRPGTTRPGGASREAIERLRSYEQRNRLEDLRRDSERRLQEDRLRDDPIAIERARQRWRHEDRQIDFRREQDRQAIERRLDTEERLEQAGERLPGPAVSTPGGRPDARAEFEQELRDVRQREQLERLRRGVGPSTGPGVRRWPR